MQEQDPIEEHYRKAFSGFEPPPPEQAWDKIRAKLHPAKADKGRMSGLKNSLLTYSRSGRIYPLLAVAAMVLLFILIWYSYSNKHNIRGHAYAGETRMCMGTAYLFKVYDKAKPYDTVLLVQSAPVDDKGFYQFHGIAHGNYMIRINPQPGTEVTRNFIPSFYDQDSASSEANVIHIDSEDPTVDVHLLPK